MSDLKGDYQVKNIQTVVTAIKILQQKNYNISTSNIKEGLSHVIKNTGLLGRWQVLNQEPKVVCDTGHNREGLVYVMKQLSSEVYNHLHIVFGVVNDKDLESIIDLLPKNATYYFCKPDISRGLDAEELRAFFSKHNLIGKSYKSVDEAYKVAKEKAEIDDFIFIGGSTFVVAEII